MEEDYTTKHNSVVKEDDHIYMLGDIAGHRGSTRSEEAKVIKRVLRKMRGIKHLVRGNHDPGSLSFYLDLGFTSVQPYKKITLSIGSTDEYRIDVKLFMSHDPSLSVRIKNTKIICLCGHVHDLTQKVGKVINVGVDVRDGYPLSLRQLIFIEQQEALYKLK
jgi:calcineurin-like phosphoesterase family protein